MVSDSLTYHPFSPRSEFKYSLLDIHVFHVLCLNDVEMGGDGQQAQLGAIPFLRKLLLYLKCRRKDKNVSILKG